jgi:hypothetical protein
MGVLGGASGIIGTMVLIAPQAANRPEIGGLGVDGKGAGSEITG